MIFTRAKEQVKGVKSDSLDGEHEQQLETLAGTLGLPETWDSEAPRRVTEYKY